MTGHAHLDSPTGEQWHIRHTYVGRTDGPYWGYIFTDEQEARTELAALRKNPIIDRATLHVRQVSLWEVTE